MVVLTGGLAKAKIQARELSRSLLEIQLPAARFMGLMNRALPLHSLPIPKQRVPTETNFFGLPPGAITAGGSLLACGGGILPHEIYDEFSEIAGGSQGRLVLIPSAQSQENFYALQARFSDWLKLPAKSLHFLDAVSRADAEASGFAEPLEDATGVWISGGEQGRLADLYRGTQVELGLRKVLERGGVVGGTSAGAAVLSQTMIRESSGAAAVLDSGFGLSTTAIIDQHFTERSRCTRLLGALRQNPSLIGLGIDEQTAVVVRGNQLRVLGRNQVTIILPAKNRLQLLYTLCSGETAKLGAVAESLQASLQLLFE